MECVNEIVEYATNIFKSVRLDDPDKIVLHGSTPGSRSPEVAQVSKTGLQSGVEAVRTWTLMGMRAYTIPPLFPTVLRYRTHEQPSSKG